MSEFDDAESLCPICGGTKAPGTTTFTADFGDGVVVVRNVKATVCRQCGEDWLAPETLKRLDDIVERARRERHLVEVMEMTP